MGPGGGEQGGRTGVEEDRVIRFGWLRIGHGPSCVLGDLSWQSSAPADVGSSTPTAALPVSCPSSLVFLLLVAYHYYYCYCHYYYYYY